MNIEKFKYYTLQNNQPLSQTFLGLKITNFRDAIVYIHDLPYGRNPERDNYYLVLTEHRGTCSTKHAIIKALADELNIQLDFVMGIFLMTALSTPAISHILEKYAIDAIPEAHCYLRFEKTAFDITFPEKISNPYELNILTEKLISPEQIGSDKVDFHRTFIQHWLKHEKMTISLDTLWQCREECIIQLGLNSYC